MNNYKYSWLVTGATSEVLQVNADAMEVLTDGTLIFWKRDFSSLDDPDYMLMAFAPGKWSTAAIISQITGQADHVSVAHIR